MKKNIYLIIMIIAAPMFLFSANDEIVYIKGISMTPLPFNERRDPVKDSPFNAFDGDSKTSALYSNFSIEFNKNVIMDQIKIINGSASDKNDFKINNRERDIEITLYTTEITKSDTIKKNKTKKKSIPDNKKNDKNSSDKNKKRIKDNKKNNDIPKSIVIYELPEGINGKNDRNDKLVSAYFDDIDVSDKLYKYNNSDILKKADFSIIDDSDKEEIFNNHKIPLKNKYFVLNSSNENIIEIIDKKNPDSVEKNTDKQNPDIKNNKKSKNIKKIKSTENNKKNVLKKRKVKTSFKKTEKHSVTKNKPVNNRNNSKSAKKHTQRKTITNKNVSSKTDDKKYNLNSNITESDKSIKNKNIDPGKVKDIKRNNVLKYPEEKEKARVIEKPAEIKKDKKILIKKMSGIVRVEGKGSGMILVYATLKDSMNFQSINLKNRYSVYKISFRTRDDELYEGKKSDRSTISEIAFYNKGKNIKLDGIAELKKSYIDRYNKTLYKTLADETFIMYQNNEIVLRVVFKKDGVIEYHDRFKCIKQNNTDCTSYEMPDRWRVSDNKLYFRYHTIWRVWKYELDSQSDMLTESNNKIYPPEWMKLYYKTENSFSDRFLDLKRSDPDIWAN